MANFTDHLNSLADPSRYGPVGDPLARWGQLVRESNAAKAILEAGVANGKLVPLRDVATVSSGVVTRANAYFIVRELPFDGIPKRFRITKGDYPRVTVVMDGLETPHRLERAYLRRIAKGPESLASPTALRESDLRLVDVTESKEKLRELRHHDALLYLKRGETVPYKVSEDTLKGGIPAKRANIKNRRPYWYSLHVPVMTTARILVPEHMDRRFIATKVGATDDVVVIDTLYTVTPLQAEHADVINWSLNSLLVWYQLELRGRTQHGEGVLKVKIPDWRGLLVLNPASLSDEEKKELEDVFAPLSTAAPSEADEALALPERGVFDALVLERAGCEEAEACRLTFERELRAAMSERHERSESVADAKINRASEMKASASVDAYASRIAAALETFPDPRRSVPPDASVAAVPIAQPIEGEVTVGMDLFSAGDVFGGDTVIASTPDIHSAEFVRAVLLHDVDVISVDLPLEPGLRDVMAQWEGEVSDWNKAFHDAYETAVQMIADPRLREQVRLRALHMLHAQ